MSEAKEHTGAGIVRVSDYALVCASEKSAAANIYHDREIPELVSRR